MPASSLAPAAVPQDPPVRRADADHVAVLTLARPASRNSLSDATMPPLPLISPISQRTRPVRAVVVEAEGPSSLPARSEGNPAHRGDADRGRAYFEDVLARCARMMTAVVRLPQP